MLTASSVPLRAPSMVSMHFPRSPVTGRCTERVSTCAILATTRKGTSAEDRVARMTASMYPTQLIGLDKDQRITLKKYGANLEKSSSTYLHGRHCQHLSSIPR